MDIAAALYGNAVSAAGGAFALGLSSAIGPCAPSRFTAVVALCADGKVHAGARRTAWFILGLIGAYALLGVAARTAAGEMLRTPGVAYAAIGSCMVLAGATLLFSGAHARLNHACASPGASVVLGGTFAFVVAPCCAPALAAVLSAAAARDSAGAALVGAAFGCAQVLPLAALAWKLEWLVARAGRYVDATVCAVIGGTVLIGIGALFGLMA